MPQVPDSAPGAYYVSMIRNGRTALLVGPFHDDHAAALAAIPAAKVEAVRCDAWAAFDAFGTARLADNLIGYPLGTLNARLGYRLSAHRPEVPHA